MDQGRVCLFTTLKAFSHRAAGVGFLQPRGPSWAGSRAPCGRRGNQASVGSCLAHTAPWSGAMGPGAESGTQSCSLQGKGLQSPVPQGPGPGRVAGGRGRVPENWSSEMLSLSASPYWGGPVRSMPTPAAGPRSPPGGSGSDPGTDPPCHRIPQATHLPLLHTISLSALQAGKFCRVCRDGEEEKPGPAHGPGGTVCFIGREAVESG